RAHDPSRKRVARARVLWYKARQMSDEAAILIEPRKGFQPIDVGEIWRYRELLYFLALRDIQVRYKQTALGVAWAILQPLLTMLVLSVIFGRLAGVPS